MISVPGIRVRFKELGDEGCGAWCDSRAFNPKP